MLFVIVIVYPLSFVVQKAILLLIDKQKLNFFYNDEFIQAILKKRIKHLFSEESQYPEIKNCPFNPSRFVLPEELIIDCCQ